jgi:general secretion pathway protein K
MLVAVVATVSAGALDRLTLATRLAANAQVVAQGRHWLHFAEQLASVRLEDLAVADPARTQAGPWLNTSRSIQLPDGGTIVAEVRDGGNCFNLNSLVRDDAGQLAAHVGMVDQFARLLGLLGTSEGAARGIAASAADWIDSDDLALPGGAEAASYGSARWKPANALFADVGELVAVRGMTDDIFSVVRPFVCALPETGPSRINPNTLLPEQAALVVMLAPDRLRLDQVRAALASRPATGFDSSIAFWKSPVLNAGDIPAEAAEQIRLRSRWFSLRTTHRSGEQEIAATTLLDLSASPARIVARRYGEEG